MSGLRWTGVQVLAAGAWLGLLLWLMDRMPLPAAYALSVVPPLLLLGGGLLYWRVRDVRRRRRLLEQEWRP